MPTNSIPIWAAKPPGIDPTTHFWFERDGVPYRICDGIRWIEGTGEDDRPDFPVPCGLCKETYLEDVLRGAKLLHLLPEPPTLKNVEYYLEINGDTDDNGLYPQKNGVYSSGNTRQGVCVMPRVPIGSFARFYESRPADQVKIVRDIRARLIDTEGYIARDYYHQLRNAIKRTHWATGNIRTLQDALVPFVEHTREHKREHYRSIAESYVSFWMERDATFFPIKSVDVEVGGLTILVKPEAGMQTGDDCYGLKFWFNATPPTRTARQVIQHMMERANNSCDEWQDSWHLGIWDIRRRIILPPLRTARDFELGLIGQSAAFLRIWDELEQQALDYGE